MHNSNSNGLRILANFIKYSEIAPKLLDDERFTNSEPNRKRAREMASTRSKVISIYRKPLVIWWLKVLLALDFFHDKIVAAVLSRFTIPSSTLAPILYLSLWNFILKNVPSQIYCFRFGFFFLSLFSLSFSPSFYWSLSYLVYLWLGSFLFVLFLALPPLATWSHGNDNNIPSTSQLLCTDTKFP